MANEQDITFATVEHDVGASRVPAGPDAGDGPPAEASPNQDAERKKAVLILLRQLASGLSAYRLFPGDLKQPSFVQVVGRIQTAAEIALAWGPFEAEINGSRFTTSFGPVPADERIDRLALLMYQHRAERFQMIGVPDIRDLDALYEALNKEAKTEEIGGVGAALRVAGVQTMSVREITPQPLGEPEMQGPITDAQRELWDKLGQPDLMSRELVEAVAGLPSAAEAAREVFARLESFLRLLPEDMIKGFEFYGRLHEVVVRLPLSLRRAVMGLLLARVREEPLAERMIGTMTDADLARVIVDQGVDGKLDPIQLARWLVEAGVRREDLVELTVALRLGRVEGGTILAGLERVGIEPSSLGSLSSMATTVSSLLARGLVGVGQEDVEAIREAFPSSTEQVREMVLGALTDYMRAETESDRLGDVVEVWAEETGAALRRRDRDQVVRMLRIMEEAREEEGAPDKRALIDATIRRILSPEVLTDLISVAAADGENKTESAIRLLTPFGEVAVDDLMDDLAKETDRGRRAVLLAILCEIARGHHDRVAKRLEDPRWFVARNAVTVLYRSGGKDVVPMLAQAARHDEPTVRREAARGLLVVAGLDVLPEMIGMAADPDPSVRATVITVMGGLVGPGAAAALGRLTRALRDHGDRRQALDALGRHPSPEALDVLEDLASTGSQPKLPGRVRRYAKSLARKRRGEAS